jgi:hypothetical protein
MRPSPRRTPRCCSSRRSRTPTAGAAVVQVCEARAPAQQDGSRSERISREQNVTGSRPTGAWTPSSVPTNAAPPTSGMCDAVDAARVRGVEQHRGRGLFRAGLQPHADRVFQDPDVGAGVVALDVLRREGDGPTTTSRSTERSFSGSRLPLFCSRDIDCAAVWNSQGRHHHFDRNF